MNKTFLIVIIFVLSNLVLLQRQAHGQPPPPPPPQEIPIDGGLAVLIAGGLIYGGKKLIEAKNLGELK